MQPPEGWRERLAQRAEVQPFFMADALASFRALEGLDDAALAAWLGCPLEALPHIALCRRPDPASPRFRAEVEQIAAHTGAGALALVRLLRRVGAAGALRGAVAEQGAEYGLLAAARDHDNSENGDQEPDDG